MSRKKNNTTVHLLPSNALPAEKALSLAVAYGSDILPEDIKNLWNLDKTPGCFLSFLAWGMHVDFWRDDLNETYKRELIGSSFAWHRKKGTPWAIKKVLADLGVDANVLEWFEIGTAPHTFAVEAEFDYANTEPFSINENTSKLLLEAIDYTKPERSHLAYFSFVPKENDDPDHRCIHDVCHWSHGYLWTDDLGIKDIGAGVWPRLKSVDGGKKIKIVGHAAYPWSELYGSSRFGDLSRLPIIKTTYIVFRKLVSLPGRAHPHRWHKRQTWLCGGAWQDGCETPRVVREILEYARSIARGSNGEPMGSINCCFSGGYELIVPDLGVFGETEFSGKSSNGAYYKPIDEFTKQEKPGITAKRSHQVRRTITWAS